MLSEAFTLTRRRLGLLLLIGGGAGAVGLLGLDAVMGLLRPERQVGFGPAQTAALIVCLLAAVLGLTLIPLPEPSLRRREDAAPVVLPRGWALARRILLGLALLAMIGYLLIYAVYAVNLMQFPFDYDQGEGFELVDTVMFSRFQWPYQDTEIFPFYSSNYPPLFHVIAAPFVWLFGPQYWYGRLLAFLGTLVTAAAIGYAVYRAEGHRLIAAIAGLSYLASNTIYHVGPLFRQHLVMVLFETLAIVVLAKVEQIGDQRQRRRVLAAGIALLLAAGYTKQLAVGTCAAVFVYLFLGNPRRGVVWGVIFAALAGAIFLWIDLSTGGQWRLNIITANVNPFVDGQFTGLFRQWFGLHGVLIVMAALVAIYELYFDRLSLYSLWFLAAAALTILAGKWGAGDSYFATAIAASALLAGVFAARTVRGTWYFPENYLTRPFRALRGGFSRRRALALGLAGVIVPALYLLYAAAVFHIPTTGPLFGPIGAALGIVPNMPQGLYDAAGWTRGYATLGHLPTAEDVANGWRLVEIAAEGDAPALSEDAAFSIRAGKPVVTNPTQLLNLYTNGLYDPTNLVAMIEDQAFGVVILRALFYPDPVLFTIGQAYREDEAIPMNGFYYHVFRPNPDWPARRALRDDLHALQAGQTVEGVIAVPQVDAEAWVTAALSLVGWQPLGEWANGRLAFVRAGERIAAEVLPVDEEHVRIQVGYE